MWKLGFLTSPKNLSQIGVLVETCISKAGKIQIECHLLKWIEDGLKFI